jgi:hypothetical protein
LYWFGERIGHADVAVACVPQATGEAHRPALFTMRVYPALTLGSMARGERAAVPGERAYAPRRRAEWLSRWESATALVAREQCGAAGEFAFCGLEAPAVARSGSDDAVRRAPPAKARLSTRRLRPRARALPLDCFAEPVIGRAFARRSWLPQDDFGYRA